MLPEDEDKEKFASYFGDKLLEKLVGKASEGYNQVFGDGIDKVSDRQSLTIRIQAHVF